MNDLQNLSNLQSTSHVLTSSVWDFYGNSTLSKLYSELHLGFYLNVASQFDIITVYCNSAKQKASEGMYDEAISLLETVKKNYPNFSLEWVQCFLLILHQKALYGCRWSVLKLITAYLKVIPLINLR